MDNFVLEPIADVERVGNDGLFLFGLCLMVFVYSLCFSLSYVGPVGCVGIVE